jgi:Uma2 family endonuclease
VRVSGWSTRFALSNLENSFERLKRRLFERGGVREYWIVDPDRNSIRIFRRDAGGQLLLVVDLAQGDNSLTTPLLPDFALRLDAFFADE